MRYILRKLIALVCLMTMIMAFTCCPVTAHDMWLEVRDYTPVKGDEISLTIAYDHHFPTRAFMNPQDLNDIYLRSENGGKIGFKTYSDVEMKIDKPLTEAGTYVIAARNNGGFFTKTTEGYKRGQTKKGLKDVISCTYSAKYSKALIHVGAAGGAAFLTPLGHDLEIIPLADPGNLKQGDFFPIRVLLKGKALPSSQVLATFIGFSTEKNTFAYAGKTDEQGKVEIKLRASGIWLISTSYVEDYPDPGECDERKLSASMTFEIR